MKEVVYPEWLKVEEFKTRGEREKTKIIIDIDGIKLEAWERKSEEVLSPFVENAVVFRHEIVLRNAKNGKKTTFYFYGSVHEYENWKVHYDDSLDLLTCVKCFGEDALSWYEYDDIDEFCKAFGYESVKACLRAYNGCKNAFKKWQRILSMNVNETADFLYNLVNTIIDFENSL